MQNNYSNQPPRFDPETGRPLTQPMYGTPYPRELKTHTPLVPFLITLIAAISLVVSFFLPYITAHRESFSMIDCASEYADLGDEYIIYTLIVAVLGIFSSLILLFAALKKPIPIIVFSILALILFYIQCWDYTDRGIVSEYTCEWATAYYTVYASLIVSFIGSIIMLSTRSKR